ncbi:hypothetical protein Y1Q_0019792 [Alligator mississippiensis]|uniref:Phorbol-ester/DAG-type domain-containing protein n=1 Tax=Alligator mississippiensis TaxID=8496 RepID=A0A151PFD2_ALLMI|nr:hypothetical protein Y1Q_0019792 [Alligator mississippiensis]
MGTAIYKLSSKIKFQVKKTQTSALKPQSEYRIIHFFMGFLYDCKYTCHSHCRDLVHLSCQRNGKLMECISTYDTLDQTSRGQLNAEMEQKRQ